MPAARDTYDAELKRMLSVIGCTDEATWSVYTQV
jgi:hypothetical protein